MVLRRSLLKAAGLGSLLAVFPRLALAQVSGGVLRVCVSEEPSAPAYDAHKFNSLLTLRTAYLAYNGLVDIAPGGGLAPDLATSWEQIDGTTYVFHLREGVLFHDGTPFDAEAVKINLERLIDPETASPLRADFTMISGIEVVDPLTVRITLSQPFTPFVSNLRRSNCAIISPKALAETIDIDPFAGSIGTGPFKFVSYARGDRVVLERFSEYWGGPAPLDGVEVRIMPEQSTQLSALETGDIDYIMQTNPAYADQITSNP